MHQKVQELLPIGKRCQYFAFHRDCFGQCLNLITQPLSHLAMTDCYLGYLLALFTSHYLAAHWLSLATATGAEYVDYFVSAYRIVEV